MSTLVYRYGLHAPHEGANIVREQMRAANRYRNTLIEIERGRRAAIRAVESEVGDVTLALAAVTRATEACEEAWREIARHRARNHKRDEPAALKSALVNARAVERDAKTSLRVLRATLKDDVRHPAIYLARVEIDSRARELAKNAYVYSGCYWGQRALVDEAAARSFAELSLYDGAETRDPGFVRSRGDGSVGLQIMGGLSVVELLSCEDTRLRLRPPVAGAWESRASTRACASTAELALRVGSEGRDPVWARWICDMARPLPDGAVVKWATVHLRQVGPHSEWSLCLTLDVPVDARAGKPTTIGGAVAIDVGWRIEGDELRVATWLDERGNHGHLRLDAATLALLRSPEAIQGNRDRLFTAARLGLAWWLALDDTAPEGLRDELRTMMQWRSPVRLERVWRMWGERRFDGDEHAYSLLTGWRWRDRELWNAAEKNRAQSLRRRREIYRVFAAQLAADYDTILVEAFDKRRVARRSDAAENEIARANRVLACTSGLVEALKLASKTRGRVCAEIPCEDSTRTCPHCGLVASRDAAGSIVLVCECGHVWDQDVGADVVLLRRWFERSRDGKMPGSARVAKKKNKNAREGEAKWDRAKRLRAEKMVKIETARKSLAGAAE